DNGKTLLDEQGKPVPVSEVPPASNGQAGRALFMEKGCVACHSHDRAVAVDKVNEERFISAATFAPDLSRVANKLPVDDKGAVTRAGRLGLIQWVLNPNLHHPRTRMPVTHLSVKEAAEIADWLLSTKDKAWEPMKVPEPATKTLQELARMSLGKAPGIPRESVDQILDKGLRKALTQAQLRNLAFDADEHLLAEVGAEDRPIDDHLMRYIGKKAIGRLGCYSCHDIPGFEAAKPIGTPLNDWGKKDPERLAFEDATTYAREHFNVVEARDADPEGKRPNAEWKAENGKPPYEQFYFEELEHRSREGFLHLKLTEPRSYDYDRLRTWDDRLRMPQFRFSHPRQRIDSKGRREDPETYRERRAAEARGQYDAEAHHEEAKAREAVMTFILGLVAEPIPLKYINTPKGPRQSEVYGRQVIEKFNCAGCHQLRPGVYEFQIPDDPKSMFTALNENAADPKSDHVFDSTAWIGRPSPIPGRLFVRGVEKVENPRAKEVTLRLTEALRYTDAGYAGASGMTRNIPAGTTITLPLDALVRTTARSEPLGGDILAMLTLHLTYPRDARILHDATFNRDDVRAYGPPPLLREGERVQTDWLYSFLLDPTRIRPKAVLRMP